MAFAAVVAITPKVLPLLERSTWKPVSLFELSFQLRVTFPLLATEPARLVGAAGGTSATVAVFE
jgi:hypothetical protein